jgi:hypothetical protein
VAQAVAGATITTLPGRGVIGAKDGVHVSSRRRIARKKWLVQG